MEGLETKGNPWKRVALADFNSLRFAQIGARRKSRQPVPGRWCGQVDWWADWRTDLRVGFRVDLKVGWTASFLGRGEVARILVPAPNATCQSVGRWKTEWGRAIDRVLQPRLLIDRPRTLRVRLRSLGRPWPAPEAGHCLLIIESVPWFPLWRRTGSRNSSWTFVFIPDWDSVLQKWSSSLVSSSSFPRLRVTFGSSVEGEKTFCDWPSVNHAKSDDGDLPSSTKLELVSRLRVILFGRRLASTRREKVHVIAYGDRVLLKVHVLVLFRDPFYEQNSLVVISRLWMAFTLIRVNQMEPVTDIERSFAGNLFYPVATIVTDRCNSYHNFY